MRAHPDAATRETLTALLFNLIKKPNAAQRRTIMDGYSAVAASAGEERTAQELLPQCWAQLEHKYPERR